MAVTDINFQEGEGQDFILEIAQGTLEPSSDILITHRNLGYLYEIPRGGGNIFIMSE
jgi:hypothetical protein